MSHWADDLARPVVRPDEASEPLVGETVRPLLPGPGPPERFAYGHVRKGTARRFMRA